MFLNDQETVTDLLYYESIAKTVVNLIRKTDNAPVTIGVHGDWGAGKSSVVNIPSPKGEGFRETAQAGYGSAKGRLQSHTILKLSSGSSGV